MDKILIATDGSTSAAEAVAFGLDLAEKQGASVFLVHVAPELDWAPVLGPAPVKVPHVSCDADRRPLRDAMDMAEQRGVDAQSKFLVGDIADEIVAYADTVAADLIVTGSRGHGAIASALLGSVSHAILHEARRPVLVVPPARVHRSARSCRKPHLATTQVARNANSATATADGNTRAASSDAGCHDVRTEDRIEQHREPHDDDCQGRPHLGDKDLRRPLPPLLDNTRGLVKTHITSGRRAKGGMRHERPAA